jgi:hypothetical protein
MTVTWPIFKKADIVRQPATGGFEGIASKCRRLPFSR